MAKEPDEKYVESVVLELQALRSYFKDTRKVTPGLAFDASMFLLADILVDAPQETRIIALTKLRGLFNQIQGGCQCPDCLADEEKKKALAEKTGA